MLNIAVSIGEIFWSLAHRGRFGPSTSPQAADRSLGAFVRFWSLRVEPENLKVSDGHETQAPLSQRTRPDGIRAMGVSCCRSRGNHLLFQQVPMVEIDGMKLVQTRSILHYIADKHHLFGKDLKERTLYCGSSGVFSIVPLPMLISVAILHSPLVHRMSCIVSANREQTSRKEYTVKISNIPTIKKFLEPGSKKKPPPDDIYVRTVYTVFMP
ncbi:GSTA4, partial [Cervus elaphus hippelaphus]